MCFVLSLLERRSGLLIRDRKWADLRHSDNEDRITEEIILTLGSLFLVFIYLQIGMLAGMGVLNTLLRTVVKLLVSVK